MKSLLRWLREEHYAQQDWMIASRRRFKATMLVIVVLSIVIGQLQAPMPQFLVYLTVFVMSSYLIIGIIRRMEREPLEVPPEVREFWSVPWWQRVKITLRSSIATPRQRRVLWFAVTCTLALPFVAVLSRSLYIVGLFGIAGVSAVLYWLWIMPVPGYRNLN